MRLPAATLIMLTRGISCSNLADAHKERARTNGVVASEIPSGIDSESSAVQHIMRDVRKLGRHPREFKNPVSEAEQAEYRLALRVRNRRLKKRVHDMLKSLKRTRETSSGNPHPAGEIPQSAASAKDGAAASEISSGSDGEHLAVQQILQDVRKLGRQPKGIKNLSRRLNKQNTYWLGGFASTS